MEFIGKWKVHSLASFDENMKKIYLTPEEYENTVPSYLAAASEEELKHEQRQRKMATSTVLSVNEDNKIYSLMPIPDGVTQEQLDEAVASGEVELMDGLMLLRAFDWKLVDDVLYYDTQIQGEILGEKVDPFKKAFDEEGFLNIGEVRYVKM